jgi:hypothetical protein
LEVTPKLRASFRRASSNRIAIGGVLITLASVAFLLIAYNGIIGIRLVGGYRVAGYLAVAIGATVTIVGLAMRLGVRQPAPRIPPARLRPSSRA